MLIAGAGNLGLHTLDQLLVDQYDKEIVFFDEKGILPKLIEGKYAILSSIDKLNEYFQKGNKEFIVTLGQPRLRERLTKRILDAGGELATIILRQGTFISNFSTFGPGTIIQFGCGISHNVKIGASNIIHASTLIGHDVIINDFVTIGSNVNILKGVEIGKYSIISPNCLIMNNVKLGRNVFIEPGVVVKNDVADDMTIEYSS
jgi:NDP-sugar pyrophosphorylase family protein